MLVIRIRELIEEKAKRENRTITQKEVADATGINESVLSRYANGFTSGFKMDVIESLMDYFEIDDMNLIIERKPKVG